MKTVIDHLPKEIQQEVLALTTIIKEEYSPEKIILFGSIPRGDWVDDSYIREGVRYTYQSDYDILVITTEVLDYKLIVNKNHWVYQKAKKLNLARPLNLICHEIEYINEELLSGSYFFSDIIKEGIILHDSGKQELGKVGDVDQEKVNKRAKEDFEYWFISADEFFDTFQDDLLKLRFNKAAFELHQATEKYYAAFLLVFIRYKPKTHDLNKLVRESIKINKQLSGIFPMETKQQEECFLLLQKAYLDARYNQMYTISKDQLDYLSLRIKQLRNVIEILCKERLNLHN